MTSETCAKGGNIAAAAARVESPRTSSVICSFRVAADCTQCKGGDNNVEGRAAMGLPKGFKIRPLKVSINVTVDRFRGSLSYQCLDSGRIAIPQFQENT